MPIAHLNLNLPVCDEVETTSLCTCACRRGIRAHPRNGRGRYVDALRVGEFDARELRDIELREPRTLGTTFVGNLRSPGTRQ